VVKLAELLILLKVGERSNYAPNVTINQLWKWKHDKKFL
tara:strand:+ start:48 stop:164 length:117 start_codon:yes stop_codon:yes gene_type:complete